MDAVKASQQIEHEESAAHDAELRFEHEPQDVVLTNSLAYMDGVLTPELVEETDLSHVPADQVDELKEVVDGGLLNEENLPFLDSGTLEKLQEDSPSCTLTEEQMRALLYVNSRLRKAQNESDVDFVDVADDDIPGPAACSVAAACVAVMTVAVYNTVAAVHTAAAAVAVETYVAVS